MAAYPPYNLYYLLHELHRKEETNFTGMASAIY